MIIEEYKTENAIVTECKLLKDDREILELMVTVKYASGFYQCFGGWILFLSKYYTHYTKEGIAGFYINRVMEICDVTTLEDAVGKAIRVVHSDSEIRSIGHIIKDDWFCPSTDLKGGEETK